MTEKSSTLSIIGAFVSLVSLTASIVTCSQVQNEAEKSIDRIKFHAMVTDDELNFFQISGDSYHVPVLNIIPTFRSYENTGHYVRRDSFSLSIGKYYKRDGSNPYYKIGPINEIVCGRQDEKFCEKNPLAKLEIVFDVFEKKRSLLIPITRN